jgi:thiol-disulfide isomerase/thioredoxin
MRIKKIILAFLISINLLCNACSCNLDKQSHTFKDKTEGIIKQTDTIILHFKNFTKTNVPLSFYYHDSLFNGTPFFINDTLVKLITNQDIFLCQPNREQIFLYLRKGMELYINADENENIISVSQANDKNNVETLFYRSLIKKFGKLYNFFPTQKYHQKFNTLSLFNSTEKLIDEVRKSRNNYLDSLVNKGLVQNSFVKTATSIIASAALTDSIILYWNNRDLLKSINGKYNDFINEKLLTIKKIEFNNNFIYQNLLVSLLSISYTNYLCYGIKNEKDYLDKIVAINKNFTGINRDFLLAKNLSLLYDLKGNVPQKYLVSFKNECKSESYKHLIEEVITQDELSIDKILNKDNLVGNDLKKVFKLADIINSNIGKVILIDVWASWCLPCREESKHLIKIKDKFKGKNVAFIGVSIDKKLPEWIRALEQDEMEKNNNYCLINPTAAEFIKKYNIYSVPRYLIINKKGIVVVEDAPKPSDKKLEILIEKYLAQ